MAVVSTSVTAHRENGGQEALITATVITMRDIKKDKVTEGITESMMTMYQEHGEDIMILREEAPEMSVMMVIIETGDYNNMVNQFYDFITSF